MRVESDGDRIRIDVAPGKRDAALAVVTAHFSEAQKTKRLLILATVASLIVAAITVVFAPEGRESLATCVGVALVALAVGAARLSRLRWNAPFGEIEMAGPDTNAPET